MNRIKRYQILCKLRDSSIDLKTELIYHSEFELLIAVLLSAQANDAQVNKVTKILFKVANTPEKILFLGVDRIRDYIKSIGLFNIKAKNIVRTCRILIKYYNSKLPEDRVKLESLPGVGRKTANIILNIVFNHPTIAVDTHVFRVCNRSGFAKGRTVELVEKKLLLVVPSQFKKDCHQWLVSHGRYICRARRPSCRICIIQELCEFKEKHYNT